ncbi:condensation domain-containing protein, partial [Streptomyces palmae]
PAWDTLPVQYADYVLWQRELLGTEDDPHSELNRQLTFWKNALRDAPDQLELPFDRPRPQIPTHRGGIVDFAIDRELHAGLVALAQESGASGFMAVQAAVAALLTRLGAGTDIPLGSAIAGRTDEALDHLIGFFINTLVLRGDTSGDPSFRELLARTRETALAAFDHQDLPFNRLVEALNPERTLNSHPLFQVMVAYRSDAGSLPRLAGLDTGTHPVRTHIAKFDLTFELVENDSPDGRPNGLSGSLEFSADLFDRETAESIAARLERLIRAVVTSPDTPITAIEVMSGSERTRLLALGSGAVERMARAASVPELFEEQVERTPDALALSAGELRLSYAELDARANRLARVLMAAGVGPESRVGMLMQRSADVV